MTCATIEPPVERATMNRRLTGKDPPRAPPEAIVWSVSPAIGPKFRLSVLGFSARFGANARVDQRCRSTELLIKSGERGDNPTSPAMSALMYQALSANVLGPVIHLFDLTKSRAQVSVSGTINVCSLYWLTRPPTPPLGARWLAGLRIRSGRGTQGCRSHSPELRSAVASGPVRFGIGPPRQQS